MRQPAPVRTTVPGRPQGPRRYILAVGKAGYNRAGHRVGALVNPPQSVFELAAATEVFGTVRPGQPPAYDFSVCARRPGMVDTLTVYPIGVDAGPLCVATGRLTAIGRAASGSDRADRPTGCPSCH